MKPVQHRVHLVQLGPIRQVGTVDHQDWQTQFARGIDLGPRRAAASIADKASAASVGSGAAKSECRKLQAKKQIGQVSDQKGSEGPCMHSG